ncbi:histidinol-phosphate transaminase [Comamonas faecalis]|uniref:histidinol-phosphate transaminase n=1 Tax=Comamonas faecalis TaxID=1387849 RepID=A0ABP7QE54_9BURK
MDAWHENATGEAPLHGGPDALGVPLHDFSTNANACGPCPQVLQLLQAADPRHYPDPAYTQLRAQLARFHGVDPRRIVLAASASEFIHRISAHAARTGLRRAVLPAHAYGDYARAARLWGLDVCTAAAQHDGAPALHWACQPSSPLGMPDAVLARWTRQPTAQGALRVIDCAYAPLVLDDVAAPTLAGDAWQLWTPNKALGLTGVRAAYAVAPAQAVEVALALQALAPSWPVGADGVALLSGWVLAQTQDWLAQSLQRLRRYKAQQLALCVGLGWQVQEGSLANFFVARLPVADMEQALRRLRGQGIKLRDCASFGLPGCVRLGVLAPPAQQALAQAWRGR